jgi:ABC-type nickel/cobalt efflux system permease component RcnA
VVAAYLVGTKLSKRGAVFLSFTYSLYLSAPAVAMIRNMTMMVRLAERYVAEYPENDIWAVPPLPTGEQEPVSL